MSATDHRAVQARLRLSFIKGPAAVRPVLRELRGHLEQCGVCRDFYDRLARVQAVSGATEGRRERIWESLVRSPALTQGSPSCSGLSATSWIRHAWTGNWRPLGGLAAAALLVLVVTRVLIPAGPESAAPRLREETFAARGPGTTSGQIGLRAFCVQPEPPHEVLGEARTGAELWCPPGRAVQVTYTAKVPVREVTVVLEGRSGEQGRTLLLGPTGSLPAGTDVPLPEAFLVPEPAGEGVLIVRFATDEGIVSQQIRLQPGR